MNALTVMNAKIPVFINCAEAIIYLLLYNLHDCTFNELKFIENVNRYCFTIINDARRYLTENHAERSTLQRSA